jgi:PAS domain S-box-containing protein
LFETVVPPDFTAPAIPTGSSAEATAALLASIVESSDDAILSKNLDGTITSWNRAAGRIFGYTSAEMVGCSILKLIPAALHSEEAEILAKLRAGGRIDHFETVRLKKNGELLPVSLTISPLKDSTGKVIGVSKILRDISERKAMEKTLMHAEKFAATEKMAATIAHEINNPLEALVNLVFLAKASVDIPAEAIGYLEAAEAELARITQIAKQSLGYFRDHVGAKRSSLEQLVKESLRTYEPKLKAAGVIVETRLDAVPELVVRQGEMLQVISNLLVNSLHAMPKGGVLRVSTALGEFDSQAAVVLSVEDTGTGIATENLGKIFEPFYTTRTDVGTGIGLWVSRRFVEGHGGRIDVESRTGHASGTKFSIVLPIENRHALA